MTAMDIGTEVAALCRQGKNQEAIDRFYAQNVESIEASAMPGIGQVQKGIQAIKGKNQWWVENHETTQRPWKDPIRMATGSSCASSMTSHRNRQESA